MIKRVNWERNMWPGEDIGVKLSFWASLSLVLWRRWFWWGAAAANVGLALLSLAGFLARLGWVFELASHFRAQYALFFTGAALLFAFTRRSKQAVVASVMAGLNLALLLPFYTTAVAAAPPETKIYRAYALNVYEDNDNYEAALTAIEEADPDLIILNEVTEKWLAELHPLAETHPYTHVVRVDGYFARVIYSRIPFAETAVVPDQERPSAVVRLNLDGQILTFIGVHPTAPVAPSRLQSRNQKLVGLAQYVRQQETPVLMMGDFNITPWSPYFQDFLTQSGLQDARLGYGLQPTFPMDRPVLVRIPIDHAVVSPSLFVHRFEAAPNASSDHAPVLLDFSLTPVQ